MNFEDFWCKRIELGLSPYCSELDLAKFFWNAAKEDSKPIAKIVERRLFGMNKSEYSVIGFDGFESAIRDTKEDAEKWAIDNGYRIHEQ